MRGAGITRSLHFFTEPEKLMYSLEVDSVPQC
jgi:hypothetical protein